MLFSLKTHAPSFLCAFALTTTATIEGAISWQPPVNVVQKGGNTASMQVARYTDGGAIAVWSWFNGSNMEN